MAFAQSVPAGRIAASEAAMKATNGKPAQFDYLIIDEFQWFNDPDTFEVLNNVLKGGLKDGKWVAFADFSNQSALVDAMKSLADLSVPMVEPQEGLYALGADPTKDQLEENCRNTANIFERMQRFDVSDSPYRMWPGASPGNEVRVRSFGNTQELTSVLNAEITRLHGENVDRNQIVVLAPQYALDGVVISEEGETNFACRFGPDNWQLFNTSHDDEVRSARGLTYCRARDFSGLESDVVILIAPNDLDPDQNDPNWQEAYRSELYIGLSRAKAELIVLVDETLPAEFKTKLESEITQ